MPGGIGRAGPCGLAGEVGVPNGLLPGRGPPVRAGEVGVPNGLLPGRGPAGLGGIGA